MPEQTTSIISKVWSLCNPLRDDGVSYGDYLGIMSRVDHDFCIVPIIGFVLFRCC